MGGRIITRTDHKALIFLKTCKLLSGRLTRWIMAIQDHDTKITTLLRKKQRRGRHFKPLTRKIKCAKNGLQC